MTLVMSLTLLGLSQSDPPDGVSSNPYLPTASIGSGGLVLDKEEEDADLGRIGAGRSASSAISFLHHRQHSRLPADQLVPKTLPENANPQSRKSRSVLSPGRTRPEEVFGVRFAQESTVNLPPQAAVKVNVDIDQRNRQPADEDSSNDILQQSNPGSSRDPFGRNDATGMDERDSPGAAQPSEEASRAATGTRCVALKDPGLCGGGERAGGKSLLRAGGKAERGLKSRSVTLPNLYGHGHLDQARAALVAALSSAWPALLQQQQQQQQQQQLGQGEEAAGDARDWSSSESADTVLLFLCTLYLPPCESPLPADEEEARVEERVEAKEMGGGGRTVREVRQGGAGTSGRTSSSFSSSLVSLSLPLPCRPLCELARGEVQQQQRRHGAGTWPADIHCHMFPTERCYTLAGLGEVKYVSKALTASGTGARMFDVIPQSVAPLETELGDEDPFDVQVMTLGTNQIPPRRYDLSDLGDPSYFQGWADVQGTGAANDYCRVVGKGKRRFLACALAGTRGQDHLYVSKLGFEPGLPGTWFMRDVDSDGRDDYCRCIGQEASSRIVCMKAGEKGFYGSTIQGGSENTFELPRNRGCHHKHLNPQFGL